MAPKALVAQLEQLLGQLKREQTTGKASGPGNWACRFCTAGSNNFPHRTTCYKCHRDKVTGVLITPVMPQGEAPRVTGTPTGTAKAGRARSQGATSGVPPGDPPTTGDAPSTGEGDAEDPITVELATARSLYDWARKLPPGQKEKELRPIQERLTKAEAADKARKPPNERLQSALSRVEHRRREAEAAAKALEAARKRLREEQEEADQAEERLDRKSTRLNSSHSQQSRMPSSA